MKQRLQKILSDRGVASRRGAEELIRSGLVDALKILKGIEGIAQIHFSEKDVVRHRLVQEIVRAYDRAAQAKLAGSTAERAAETKESR